MLNRTSSQNMWQMECAYVSVQGWVIDPYEQCFFYCSVEVLVFPPHYTKVIYGDIVTSGVKIVIYWGRCLLMFLEPFSKCSWGLSNVFLITIHPVTFVSINDPSPLLNWILIFWSHQEVLDGVASFKADLHSMFTAHFLQALTQPFTVRYHHVWFLVVVLLTSFCGISSLFVGWAFCLDLNSNQSPCRVFTFLECFL